MRTLCAALFLLTFAAQPTLAADEWCEPKDKAAGLRHQRWRLGHAISLLREARSHNVTFEVAFKAHQLLRESTKRKSLEREKAVANNREGLSKKILRDLSMVADELHQADKRLEKLTDHFSKFASKYAALVGKIRIIKHTYVGDDKKGQELFDGPSVLSEVRTMLESQASGSYDDTTNPAAKRVARLAEEWKTLEQERSELAKESLDFTEYWLSSFERRPDRKRRNVIPAGSRWILLLDQKAEHLESVPTNEQKWISSQIRERHLGQETWKPLPKGIINLPVEELDKRIHAVLETQQKTQTEIDEIEDVISKNVVLLNAAEHDARACLNAAGGYPTRLKRKLNLPKDSPHVINFADPAAVNDHLEELRIAQTEIVKAHEIILDTQDLSGAVNVKKVPIRLHKFVFDNLRTFAWNMKNKNGNVVPILSGAPESVMIKPGQLLRLFDNLMRNAVRCSDKLVEVTCGTRLITGANNAGKEFFMKILNDGEQVPADMQEHIFQSGVQLANGTKGAGGIGLSVVADIARQLNGKVSVESPALIDGIRGGGAVFEVSWPIED